MEIKIVALRNINGSGPLRAFASVQFGDWIIHNWRLIKKDGQRAWISYPQVTWKDADGKVRYKSLISIPGELKQKIDIAILSAWEEEKKVEHHL